MPKSLKPPLYVLPHGIEVIAEYAPSGSNRYWRVRIRPHRFFPDVPVRGGGYEVRRSRVVMAAKLGRALTSDELVHHRNEDKNDDSPENLELTTFATHNAHHKTGTTQSPESRAKTSESLSLCYARGLRRRTSICSRDEKGKILWTS